ncbi:MAG: hypothetical protein GXP25_17220 [Planctomycetes bacterium]|nr:hypothetical protein [Planctomycetota bacterium]
MTEIIMVKRQNPDGSECTKCKQATKILEQKGLWDMISKVAYAIPGDNNSEGVKLAKEYNMKKAPFFIVKHEGETKTYASILKFVKDAPTFT